MSTLDAIRERLAVLQPTRLDIVDESHLHAGHAGARSGGGHYRISIISPRFAGLDTLQRHRLVYDSLGALMKREIHAMSITAASPEENTP